jgi:2-keto-4-pentenoate hydratase/2-oxohepta-3-ene-1,7-dioic acid hydratase in catechol pathway
MDSCHASLKQDITFENTPLLPFQPLSYRDFMLFEKHAVDAARGYARRFIPLGYAVGSLYERISGKTFPPFRPKKIWYEKPIYYLGNHLNFITSNGEVAFPSYSRALDYELELGALITRPLKNATPAEALSAIGGFVVFNDFSARDVQLPEMKSGFGPSKAKHFINAVSDVIVSADNILPHLESLQAEVRINGKCIVRTSSAGMHHGLGQAIAYASLDEQLYPGEFFATGTLPGGSGMENGHWLKRGDTIELWIDLIGTLSNTIL